jgi:hypothetical protein
MPISPNQPYDMKKVITAVVDDGEYLEVPPPLGHEPITCGFARIERPGGRHRRQPAGRARRRARHRLVGEGRALRADL